MPYKVPCTGQSTARRYRSPLIVAVGNDAGFRAWGSELDYNLTLAGLLQTADTGQIDWTTVTFPAVNNTIAGYTIWRFNPAVDTLQSQSPIYIKFEYGRGGSANTPMMWITVGRGSDGTGTITDIFFPQQIIFVNTAPQVEVLNNQTWSYISHVDGFLGIAFKTNPNVNIDSTAGITGSMVGGVFLSRTTTPAGVMTPLGITMLSHNVGGGNSISQIARRFQDTAATYGVYDCAGVILSQGAPAYPSVLSTTGGPSGSSRRFIEDNGDPSTGLGCYPIWTTMPRVMPLAHVCTVVAGDFPIGREFYAAVVGQAKKRFITVGGKAGVGVANIVGVPYLAMIWP
ncbi:hypothetical protein C4587_01850 [Candidatus Parcubacteria bacterium]|nr:MAG: hypothetical protein C4587_01850 [Candidatus Parcubacteria bacterium]